jgi:hypothetical protein
MAADRPYDEFYDFYSVSPEYLRYTLVCHDSFLLGPSEFTIYKSAYNGLVGQESSVGLAGYGVSDSPPPYSLDHTPATFFYSPR